MASKTLANLVPVDEAASLPALCPLIGREG
ncbi:hypothetical protein SVEN_5554 [Streptomyces venezuelae ATCC 10712]|uniref:Uncharacterized protein n=1 Tax=Streptomyces venezuelae (strain ATCC 10712 / CBS 650.69 / DSM 40230 / JCM 4526 / NBRC 13096 / PD 04745) TaxID=953739 RepID=F2R831_STRVP|nr:hypothetical protein SVEN_5554 [Streptomyces venezuelae ATCC 10712]